MTQELCDNAENDEVAYEAGVEVGWAEERAKIAHWLSNTNFGDQALNGAATHFADMVRRGVYVS